MLSPFRWRRCGNPTCGANDGIWVRVCARASTKAHAGRGHQSGFDAVQQAGDDEQDVPEVQTGDHFAAIALSYDDQADEVLMTTKPDQYSAILVEPPPEHPSFGVLRQDHSQFLKLVSLYVIRHGTQVSQRLHNLELHAILLLAFPASPQPGTARQFCWNLGRGPRLHTLHLLSLQDLARASERLTGRMFLFERC